MLKVHGKFIERLDVTAGCRGGKRRTAHDYSLLYEKAGGTCARRRRQFETRAEAQDALDVRKIGEGEAAVERRRTSSKPDPATLTSVRCRPTLRSPLRR
jgi:hypothetical protein